MDMLRFNSKALIFVIACLFLPYHSFAVEVKLALAGQVGTVNPLNADSREEQLLVSAVYEGLTTFTPDTLEVVGGVAKHWAMSSDRKHYIFYLRENARWSDGRRVVPQDFVRGWQRVLSAKRTVGEADLVREHIDNAQFYLGTESTGGKRVELNVEVVSETILKVALTYPIDYLPKLLALPIFSPYPQARKSSSTPVYNGAFVLSSMGEDAVVLEKNPYYWGQRGVQIDRVVAKLTTSAEQVAVLLEQGKLHWSGTVDMSSMPVNKPSVVACNSIAVPGMYFLDFTNAQGVYRDPSVRRALSLSIDQKLLRQFVLQKGAERGVSFVPFASNYYKANYILAHRDEEAQGALEELGYCKGQSQENSSCVPMPKLTLHYSTNHGRADQEKKLTLAVADRWRQILGIEVDVHAIEMDNIVAGADHSPVILLRYGWVQYPSLFAWFEYWRPYYDQKYRLKLREALVAINPAQRSRALAVAERHLVSELAVVPIAEGKSTSCINSKLKGFYQNVLDIHPLKNIYFPKS